MSKASAKERKHKLIAAKFIFSLCSRKNLNNGVLPAHRQMSLKDRMFTVCYFIELFKKEPSQWSGHCLFSSAKEPNLF